MPTWLGILLFGSLFGRRRRSFGRSLLLGGLLGWLFHRNFDMDEMQADMHKAARKVRKAVKSAKHEFRDIGRAVREQARMKTDEHVDAVLEQVEASQARDEERRRRTDEKIAAAQAKIEEVRARQEEREQRKAERLNNTLERMETVRARHHERQQEIAEHLAAVRAEIAEQKAERLNNTIERMEAHRALQEERRAEREQQKAEQADNAYTRMETVRARHPEVDAESRPAGNEALLNRELVAELERNARTAAMAADVPTIDFPEEEKYYASKKYLFTGE